MQYTAHMMTRALWDSLLGMAFSYTKGQTASSAWEHHSRIRGWILFVTRLMVAV